MLDPAVPFLACPHCRGSLTRDGRSLRCPVGHAFDIARQGYVSLRPGGSRSGGDTAQMVRARADFLAVGHFDPLVDRLAELAESAADDEGCVVDVGAGTGRYLAAVLDRLPGRVGLALDASRYALRRAASAHARIGAIGCDVWRGMPVADGVAALALNVFAPRNAAELARILPPSGRLIVVTPTRRHLAELVAALDLLTVDERKEHRLADRLGRYFEPVERHQVTATMRLSHGDVCAAVAMGPSARHTSSAAVVGGVRRLPDPATVTLSVTVGVYRPAG